VTRARRLSAALSLAAACLALPACGGPRPVDPRYPPLPEGCAVQVFEDSPPRQTDNLGPVRARCTTDVGREACLRTLKDAACRLGADVVWGVADAPRVVGDKNEWSGRAAHTR